MSKKSIKLRTVVSLLVFLSILAALVISAFAALQVNKKSLEQSYLDSNYQYAQKTAYTANILITNLMNHLLSISEQAAKYSIDDIQRGLDDNWQARKTLFNSMIVVDNELFIKAITPNTTGAKIGDRLISFQAQEANTLQRPYISEPYKSFTGRLIILISVPIFDQSRDYKGLVAGTIYLHENNSLENILGQHFYDNGSYMYVVDKRGNIIFHPRKERIGASVPDNPVVKKMMSGLSGAEPVINSEGIPFLAGYAVESYSGWGIVAQTPTTIIEVSSRDIVNNMILLAAPFFILIMIVALLLTTFISKPFFTLAKFTEEIIDHSGKVNSVLPNTKSKIYEVKLLHHSTLLALNQISNRLHLLDIEIQTDALSGVANRRTFDLVINDLVDNQTPFSLIYIDIDKFKSINDTYGHLKGDEVIKFLAKTMQELAREGDLCFRYGGEEFAVIVPLGDKEISVSIAEQLRDTVAQMISPTGSPITISLGIAVYPEHGETVADIIEHADQAMYQSKKDGRNRTTMYA